MKNIKEINDLMPLTPDHNQERLDTIKKLYPDLFTLEGKLDINELLKLENPENINEVERYEFRWFGKSKAKREAFMPTDATLIYDASKSINPNNSDNIIIEGENLNVLKLLSTGYRNKIKCIYIDPPYNVDADAVYIDDYSESKKPYWENIGVTENGVVIDTNYEASGRFHSNWLNMMYSRLLIARSLLKENGMIFIQIDDKEFSNLRKIADEIFGEDNFITSICVKMSHLSGMKMSHKDKKLPKIKEFILLYSKNKDDFSINPIYIKGEWENVLDRYNYFVHIDENQPCEEWKIEHINEVLKKHKIETEEAINEFRILNAHKIFRTAVNDSLKNKEKNVFFERIITKTGLNKLIYKQEEVLFASSKIKNIDGKNVPAESIGDIWLDIGINNLHNEGGVPFPNGKKPYKLIKRILELGTNENDIILDFFAGSGTTAQAVMELNHEDGGSRQCILVQIPEATDHKSEAYKAGYKKISDITIERNKRVVEKLIAEKKAQNPDLFSKPESEKEQLKGLGFKIFRLTKSQFPRTEWRPEIDKTDQENIQAFKDYVKVKELQLTQTLNINDLLIEILIKRGFELTFTIAEQPQFKHNKIELVKDSEKTAFICLDGELKEETVEYFKTNTDTKFICLERALNTTKKWNLKHYMKEKIDAF